MTIKLGAQFFKVFKPKMLIMFSTNQLQGNISGRGLPEYWLRPLFLSQGPLGRVYAQVFDAAKIITMFTTVNPFPSTKECPVFRP